ncbi:hypothetical protein [Jeotgalibacillus malaysiensis]|uniref:hypothetical protein n=1 Tax=Jeotgalibacillus malaysiensis TaxID=1508404 RepID=UPI00384F8BE6
MTINYLETTITTEDAAKRVREINRLLDRNLLSADERNQLLNELLFEENRLNDLVDYQSGFQYRDNVYTHDGSQINQDDPYTRALGFTADYLLEKHKFDKDNPDHSEYFSKWEDDYNSNGEPAELYTILTSDSEKTSRKRELSFIMTSGGDKLSADSLEAGLYLEPFLNDEVKKDIHNQRFSAADRRNKRNSSMYKALSKYLELKLAYERVVEFGEKFGLLTDQSDEVKEHLKRKYINEIETEFLPIQQELKEAIESGNDEGLNTFKNQLRGKISYISELDFQKKWNYWLNYMLNFNSEKQYRAIVKLYRASFYELTIIHEQLRKPIRATGQASEKYMEHSQVMDNLSAQLEHLHDPAVVAALLKINSVGGYGQFLYADMRNKYSLEKSSNHRIRQLFDYFEEAVRMSELEEYQKDIVRFIIQDQVALHKIKTDKERIQFAKRPYDFIVNYLKCTYQIDTTTSKLKCEIKSKIGKQIAMSFEAVVNKLDKKQCKKCKKEKFINEFYADEKNMTDGRKPFCKQCEKVQNKKNSKKNKQNKAV